jgi:biopolymer transport protein ExbB
MFGAKARERLRLERNLAFLGTLGNNAPFIGLFGTVLGIIKAFHDLAGNQAGGITVVMSGISEALVSTAIGLLVAIPAVIAFNFFNRRVRTVIANVDSLAHVVLAQLKGEEEEGGGASKSSKPAKLEAK